MIYIFIEITLDEAAILTAVYITWKKKTLSDHVIMVGEMPELTLT